MKNIFNVGDKVTVKENFWEIEIGVYDDNRKKLAGRTLEVESIGSDGDVFTKQDDSNDYTRWFWDKNWIELYTEPKKEITLDTLKWKDVVIDENGNEQIVLGVLNDSILLSSHNFDYSGNWFHKKELQNRGYVIKQATPPQEKLELTLDQIAEKFGVDVINIKIKK